MMWHTMRGCWIGAAGALICATQTLAQLPSPTLTAIRPCSAQAGTTVEVSVTGSNLDGASAFVSGHPGITAAVGDGGKFKVSVAADCPPGVYEVRVAGRHGISQARTFVVGPSAVMLDPGGNFTRATAPTIPFPCVVDGVFDAGQREFYKLPLKKGARVAVASTAIALDSPADPVLAVISPEGRTIARGDDDVDRDAIVHFDAPLDGDYLVVVNDKVFAGSPSHTYRLEVGVAVSRIPLLRPADAAQWDVPGLKAMVAKPGRDPQPCEVPAKIEGCFTGTCVEFHGTKDKPVWIEVIGARTGAPCDPVLAIEKVSRDEKGAEQRKQVLELDDTPEIAGARLFAGSADPAGRWVPDETAVYRVRVRDRFRSAHPVSMTLVIREASPDFALLALSESPANDDKKKFVWQPTLRRGGGVAFAVGVLRRGYDGEIRLRCEGLPEGVRASGTVAAGAATGTLVIAAAPDAKPWSGSFKMIGEGGGVAREASGVTYRWSVGDRGNERLDARVCRMALALIDEAAPLQVSAVAEKGLEAAIGGVLELPVKFSRPAPLSVPRGEWIVSVGGLPGLNKAEPLKIDGGSATDGKLVVRLENKDGNAFVAGTYDIHVRATGKVARKSDEKAKEQELVHIELSGPVTVKLNAPPQPVTSK